MAHNLVELIKASGYAGVSGQSFRNHVTGAASGIKMRDYLIASASFFSPFEPNFSYADGITHTFSASMGVYGLNAIGILNKVSGAWQITPIEIDGGTGFSAQLTSITWNPPSATGSLYIRSAYTPGTPSVNTSVYYTDFVFPATPPDNADYNVQFAISSGSVAASGTGSMYINVAFTPDMYSAGFNPAMNNASNLNSWIISTLRRENPNQPIEVEWYTDSSFTTLHTTNMTFLISSNPNTDVSYWVRYRNQGSSDPWTQYGGSGEVHWVDPRLDV